MEEDVPFNMKPLSELIATHEEWLMHRVLYYAKDQGYTKHTSTLAEAWRISIKGLSDTLISAIQSHNAPPELDPDEKVEDDPIAAFGVQEARRHRARGISIAMFLGLMKYYRQSYIDLLLGSSLEEIEQEHYTLFVNRVFDRVEIGFCSEWLAQGDNARLDELQAANRSITNEKNKYLTIFESIHEPIFLLDRESQIDNLNHSAALLLTGMNIPGSRYYDESPNNQYLPWLNDKLKELETRTEGESAFDIDLETLEGTRWFHVRLKRMLDVSEKFWGTVVTLNDITKRKQMEEQLRVQLLTDELTGLYNRRGFLVMAEQHVKMARRLKKGMIMIAIDMDDLKTINDRYGHQEGDAAIAETALILKQCFRESDIIGRMGGDEFAVLLLEGVDIPSEQTLTDRLTAHLRVRNEDKGRDYQLSFSIGIFRCPQECTKSLDELLAQADTLMYQQKQSKRTL
jgi:diguanylate cyclase (GGDEF)-like protein/PAS domain S-box-containing protein